MHSRELKLALKDYLESLSEASAAFGRFMVYGDASEWLDASATQDYHLIELVKAMKENK